MTQSSKPTTSSRIEWADYGGGEIGIRYDTPELEAPQPEKRKWWFMRSFFVTGFWRQYTG